MAEGREAGTAAAAGEEATEVEEMARAEDGMAEYREECAEGYLEREMLGMEGVDEAKSDWEVELTGVTTGVELEAEMGSGREEASSLKLLLYWTLL